MSASPLIECVPNFSEGRDLSIIAAIEKSILETDGVSLLHVDIGYDANRTVMTFAGAPQAVCGAAFNACKTASLLIDMSQQKGTHPRLGAMDVCPLVALNGITPRELVTHSNNLARRIGEELNIPVYLYEHSSTKPHRKRLEQIRKGGYEKFPEKILTDGWLPDFGPATFNKQTGATVLGVRDLLLAFNINLDTQDVTVANRIARIIRTSGYKGTPGKFKHLKAIGWFVDEFGCAQVSTNITNFQETPAHEVYEAIKKEASKLGVKVTGSELIGLMPLAAVEAAGNFYCKDLIESEAIIRSAIVGLGLADKQKFVPRDRILDLLLMDNELSQYRLTI